MSNQSNQILIVWLNLRTFRQWYRFPKHHNGTVVRILISLHVRWLFNPQDLDVNFLLGGIFIGVTAPLGYRRRFGLPNSYSAYYYTCRVISGSLTISMVQLSSIEERSTGTETVRGERLTPTWNNVAARIVAGRGAVTEILHREQNTAFENVPGTDLNRSSDINSNTDVTETERSLPGNAYFGYTYTFAISLSLISLIFLCLSLYSVYRSLRDPGNHPHGLTVLPSFPLVSGKCEQLAWVSGGLHLIVNILGSIIFGISIYLQQLCTSPTLHDIQKEVRQEGGDIRFGSILPFGLVRRRKRGLLFVWLLLLATSLPIHLAFNGALGYAYNAYQLTGRVIRDDDLDSLTEVEFSWPKATGGDCFRFRSQYGLDIEVSNITLIVNGSGSTELQDYLLKQGKIFCEKANNC